jgi:hypothetical protein
LGLRLGQKRFGLFLRAGQLLRRKRLGLPLGGERQLTGVRGGLLLDFCACCSVSRTKSNKDMCSPPVFRDPRAREQNKNCRFWDALYNFYTIIITIAQSDSQVNNLSFFCAFSTLKSGCAIRHFPVSAGGRQGVKAFAQGHTKIVDRGGGLQTQSGSGFQNFQLRKA